MHTFALLNNNFEICFHAFHFFFLWVIKRIFIHAGVLEQTLSFNFVFMCPKNPKNIANAKGWKRGSNLPDMPIFAPFAYHL